MAGANIEAAYAARRRVRPKLHGSATALAAVLMISVGGASWAQEKIGGAEIVINQVAGSLPSGSRVPVVQGDDILRNEAVSTGDDSKVSFVLKDSSDVTVGPASTVRLNEFVYSGAKQPGTISLGLSNGTLRWVAGDAGRRAYTILTPTAAIGVRGKSLRIRATPTETQVINEEGTTIVCLRGSKEKSSLDELQRSCKGDSVDQVNIHIAGTKGPSCPCTTLLLPSEQATVATGNITVSEAPADAITEPFVGPPKDYRLLAADLPLPTKKPHPEPIVETPPPAANPFPVWPVVGIPLLALLFTDPDNGSGFPLPPLSP